MSGKVCENQDTGLPILSLVACSGPGSPSPHGRKQQAGDAGPWNARKGKGASSLAWGAHSKVQIYNTDVEVTVIFSKQTLRVIRIYQRKTDSPFRRSSFRTLEHGLCKQVTFLVDLALPRSVQEARTKSPKTAASNRNGGCAPLAQTVFSIAPSFAIFLASHACISVCIFSDLFVASSLDLSELSMPSRSRSRSPDYDRSPSRGRSYNSRSKSRSRSPSRRRSQSRGSRSPPPRRNGRTRDSRSRSFTRSRSRDDRARSLSRGRSRSRTRSESPLKSTKVGGIACPAHVQFAKPESRLSSSV